MSTAREMDSAIVPRHIDRSELNFSVRPRTLLRAGLASLVVCAALPAAAIACLLAGAIAFGACWLVVIVLAAFSYGLVLGGGGMIVYGLSEQNHREAAGGGVAVGVLGLFLASVFTPWFAPLKAAADSALAACRAAADFVYTEIFLGYYVYVWCWAWLAGALLLAAGVLLLILLLRLEPLAKRYLLRIRYSCPAADCGFRDLPWFRCSRCRSVISDLTPTVHGVLSVRCGGCGERLPTCDVAGRLRLEKQCPQCAVDLTHPGLGRLSETHFVFAGAASSGKSNLLVMALREFERAFAPRHHIAMQFANPAEEQDFRSRVNLLDQGRVLDKTISPAQPAAFNVSVEPCRGRGTLLYLYDTDGSDFESEDRLLQHSFHEITRGIVLVLDPLAQRRIVERLSGGGAGAISCARPAQADVSIVLSHIIGRFERAVGQDATKRFDIPVAVVVTKADVDSLQGRLGGVPGIASSRRSLAAQARRAEANSPRVRQFLRDGGLGNTVNNVESRFHPVAYFAVSALGRSYDPDDSRPFEPRGVVEPLLWLCHRSGAVSDMPVVWYMLGNGWEACRRSLGGQEGRAAAISAWTFTSSATVVILMTAVHFVGFVPTVASAVTAAFLSWATHTLRQRRRAWRD